MSFFQRFGSREITDRKMVQTGHAEFIRLQMRKVHNKSKELYMFLLKLGRGGVMVMQEFLLPNQHCLRQRFFLWHQCYSPFCNKVAQIVILIRKVDVIEHYPFQKIAMHNVK